MELNSITPVTETPQASVTSSEPIFLKVDRFGTAFGPYFAQFIKFISQLVL